MGKHEIIDMALQLKAAERYEVVEKIMQSLDKSDPEIDRTKRVSITLLLEPSRSVAHY